MKRTVIDALYEKVVQSQPKGTEIKIIHGRDGRNGRDGKDGKDGKDGIRGLAGLPGKDGKDGLPGIQGERGMMGPPGLAGRNGIDGKDGERGPPGPKGEDGRGIYNIRVEKGFLVISYTDTSITKIRLSDVDELGKIQSDFKDLKSYVDKRVATAVFGHGGGGNLSATVQDIHSKIDNMTMVTPTIMNEYLWKINTILADGGNKTVSYDDGLYQKINLTEDTTIEIDNFPDMDYLGRLTLEIINTNNKTINWVNTISWNSGIEPDLSGGNSIIVFTTTDSGNTLYGNVVGQNYST